MAKGENREHDSRCFNSPLPTGTVGHHSQCCVAWGVPHPLEGLTVIKEQRAPVKETSWFVRPGNSY